MFLGAVLSVLGIVVVGSTVAGATLVPGQVAPSFPDASDSSAAAASVWVGALTPASGTAGGGDTVEISGSGFTGATAVYFGGNPSSDFSVTSPTTITAVAPVGAGVVDVQVVTPAGTSGLSSLDRFTYVPTGQLPITAQGQHLQIGGVPTVFTGYNAYQLATDWGTNAGCGGTATTAQIDAFFASLNGSHMPSAGESAYRLTMSFR